MQVDIQASVSGGTYLLKGLPPLWVNSHMLHTSKVSCWNQPEPSALSMVHMLGSNGKLVPLVCSLVCVHTNDYRVVYNNNEAAASLSASGSFSSDQCCSEKCSHNSRLILMILTEHFLCIIRLGFDIWLFEWPGEERYKCPSPSDVSDCRTRSAD